MSALDELLLKTYGNPVRESSSTAEVLDLDPNGVDASETLVGKSPQSDPSVASSDPPSARREDVAADPVGMAAEHDSEPFRHDQPTLAAAQQGVGLVGVLTATAVRAGAEICQAQAASDHPRPQDDQLMDQPLGDVSSPGPPPVDVSDVQHDSNVQAPAKPIDHADHVPRIDDDVTEHAASHSSFKPQWEVDSFVWPAICKQIRQCLGGELLQLAAKIVDEYQREGLAAILVTSAHAGAGRTSLMLSLAQTIAEQGTSLAMVDLDHRHPALVERLGVIVDEGLEKVDGQATTAASICVASLQDHVTLAPLAEPLESASCLQPAIQEALLCLAKYHEVVLIDASSEVADLLVRYGTGLKYGVILVNDAREETAAAGMMARFQGTALHPVGVMENYAA